MRDIILMIGLFNIIFPAVEATEEIRPPMLLGVGELLQVSVSLIIVLVVIALATWLLRRFVKWGTTAGGMLRILGGISLGGRERVVLIQVGERQILLGVAPGAVRTLYILDEPIMPSAQNFAQVLHERTEPRL